MDRVLKEAELFCTVCGTRHPAVIKTGLRQARVRGETVTYQAFYCECPKQKKEFETPKMAEDNRMRAYTAYMRKYGKHRRNALYESALP